MVCISDFSRVFGRDVCFQSRVTWRTLCNYVRMVPCFIFIPLISFSVAYWEDVYVADNDAMDASDVPGDETMAEM